METPETPEKDAPPAPLRFGLNEQNELVVVLRLPDLPIEGARGYLLQMDDLVKDWYRQQFKKEKEHQIVVPRGGVGAVNGLKAAFSTMKGKLGL